MTKFSCVQQTQTTTCAVAGVVGTRLPCVVCDYKLCINKLFAGIRSCFDCSMYSGSLRYGDPAWQRMMLPAVAAAALCNHNSMLCSWNKIGYQHTLFGRSGETVPTATSQIFRYCLIVSRAIFIHSRLPPKSILNLTLFFLSLSFVHSPGATDIPFSRSQLVPFDSSKYSIEWWLQPWTYSIHTHTQAILPRNESIVFVVQIVCMCGCNALMRSDGNPFDGAAIQTWKGIEQKMKIV